MICFEHSDIAAVGICRICGRGVCRSCAHVEKAGLACSSACQEYAEQLRITNARAMAAYGIVDGKSTLLSNWILCSALPGIVFFAIGAASAYRAAYIDNSDAFAMAAGAVFTFGGIYQHFLQRRVGK